MKVKERYTKTLAVKLPEAAYQRLRQAAFQQSTAMAELARKALFKQDGSLRHDKP